MKQTLNNKGNNISRAQTSKRVKVVCFTFWCFLRAWNLFVIKNKPAWNCLDNLISLYYCAAYTYLLSFEVSLCLLISFSPPCATLKPVPHAVQKKTLTCSEFTSPQIVEFQTIFILIVCHLKCKVLTFFTVPILLGNNRKIGLKWKQNLMTSRRYGYGADNLKSHDIWKFQCKISINYMLFWKF